MFGAHFNMFGKKFKKKICVKKSDVKKLRPQLLKYNRNIGFMAYRLTI